MEVSSSDSHEEDTSGEASAGAVEVDADGGGGTLRRRYSKPIKPSNPCSFRNEPSLMINELAKELVKAGLIREYILPVGEEELHPEYDEVVVFLDYFVVGLVIPCH